MAVDKIKASTLEFPLRKVLSDSSYNLSRVGIIRDRPTIKNGVIAVAKAPGFARYRRNR